jgi:hypothetical protein
MSEERERVSDTKDRWEVEQTCDLGTYLSPNNAAEFVRYVVWRAGRARQRLLLLLIIIILFSRMMLLSIKQER